MLSLDQFIFKNDLENELFNRLYFHTCIEFKLDHNLYPYIIESLGKFDNAGLVLEYIINILKKDFCSQLIDCKEYKVYFDNIDIIIKDGTGRCSYINYKNNTVKIEIYSSKEFFIKNIDEYIKLILHELLHGYEDYNRIKNTGKSIFDYLNDKYENSFNNLNSQNELKMWLSRCNYLLNDQERNAYLSQLELDIEKIFKDKHISIENFNYTEFKNILKNTDMWKIYFELQIFILKIYNSKWSDEQKKYIEDIWKQTYKENKKFSQIRKELYYNWQNFEKKFEQLVPKLICKYIESNLKEVAFDINLLNESNYWKNII